MTLKELNEVRNLKKQLEGEQKKLNALKIVVGAFPHKYGQSEEGGAGSGGTPKSAFESYVVQIADTEKNIEKLQQELTQAVPRLTEKIQTEFIDSAEQTLLIYRYVACKFFRDIGFLMGYSERRVYKIHEQVIKKCSQVQLNAVGNV